jgi:hypothetical protein
MEVKGINWLTGKTMPGLSCIRQSMGFMATAPFLITIVLAVGSGYGAGLTSRGLAFVVSQAAELEGVLDSGIMALRKYSFLSAGDLGKVIMYEKVYETDAGAQNVFGDDDNNQFRFSERKEGSLGALYPEDIPSDN